VPWSGRANPPGINVAGGYQIVVASGNGFFSGAAKQFIKEFHMLTKKSAAREASMQDRYEIFIIRKWCKNCGICAAFCPGMFCAG
jgi:hypothetical protein